MGIRAWKLASSDQGWAAQQLWHNRDVSLSMSSPVLAGGLIVGFSQFRKGQIFVLDPGDGELLWRGAGRWGEHATLIAAGDRLLVFREDGSLLVGEVSASGFRPSRTYRVGSSRMWSHPAIVGKLILIRDRNRLKVYRVEPSSPSHP